MENLNELIDRIHKGQEPFAAAYEMTKDAMGSNGATFAQMSKIAKELVDREMPSKYSEKGYKSSLAGYSSTNQKIAKTSDEGDIFSGLLSKFGLGKEDQEKIEKEKALLAYNNSRKIASVEDGIHPAGPGSK
jgi:hypothetical protein